MLPAPPPRQPLQKTSGGPMGYGSLALTTEHAAHESMSPQTGSLHEAAASSDLSSSPELSCPRDRGSFRRPARRRHHPGHCGLTVGLRSSME
jgi:hypothetical protein